MNSELLAKSKQDFYYIKLFIPDNRKIAQYLRIDFSDATKINNTIKACTETGHIEAKRQYLNNMMSIIDDALYKMITPGKLIELLKIANTLVFMTVITYKAVAQKKKTAPKVEKTDYPLDKIDIKDIIRNIPVLSKNYPESVRYIRLITTLLKKYKEISLSMEEKLLVAPEKTKESIKKTFTADLQEIITSIKKQYINMNTNIPELKKEFDLQFQTIANNDESQDMFYEYNFHPLKQYLLKQLSEFSKIRSSIAFIKEEGLDVLAILTDIYKQKKELEEFIANEEMAVFNTMHENKIEVNQFNSFLYRITDEIKIIIQDKFVNPYM